MTSARLDLPRLSRPCLDLCLDLQTRVFAAETAAYEPCLDCLDLPARVYTCAPARPRARAHVGAKTPRQSRQSRQQLIGKGFSLPRPCLDLDQGLDSNRMDRVRQA